MAEWLYHNNTSLEFGGLKIEPPSTPPPPPLSANMLRFRFSDPSFDPTNQPGLLSNDWSWSAQDASSGIWDLTVTKTGSDWTLLFSRVFHDFNMGSVTAEIIDSNLSGVTICDGLFEGCSSLTGVVLGSTGTVTIMAGAFEGCTSLASVTLSDTSSVTDMSYMFSNCLGLVTIPLIDTSSVTDMSSMFAQCLYVQSGALALYQQASGQTTPPSTYTDCFANCGSSTTTGAAELAQIPTSWGGTAS